MKKAILLLLCPFILIGCSARESTNYVASGYYADNTVITDDGNIWDYQTEMHDGSVHVVFNDNGTADNIYDDIIIDLIQAK